MPLRGVRTPRCNPTRRFHRFSKIYGKMPDWTAERSHFEPSVDFLWRIGTDTSGGGKRRKKRDRAYERPIPRYRSWRYFLIFVFFARAAEP